MKEFLYSRNAVYETLRARRRQGIRLQVAENVQDRGHMGEILAMAAQRKIPVVRAPRTALDRIHPQHQGVILETGGYPYCNIEDMLELAAKRDEPPFILILDTLQDPQNFGTLLRTAEAIGVHGVIIPLARTVEVTPAVVNASSGASEHLLVAQANLSQAIDRLKEADVWVVGLDQNGQTEAGPGENDRSPLRGALALAVGSEGEGLRPLTRSKCDLLLKLPMRGQVESLNAAVAGSVALYLAYLAR
jgi:23S rRNA (guanosine2251-2'-O)-methyltransferase